MESKGFFASLFDFSFESFVFPKLIRVIYTIVVIMAGLAYVAGVVYGFQLGTAQGAGALVLGPLVIILYLIMVRVWMEVAIVLFRIYENTNVIAEK